MPTMINPFDENGFTVAVMTKSINFIPNTYRRVGELGLFRREGVTQRTVIIENQNGVLNLLPSLPLGAPASLANKDTRNLRAFAIPHIPHDDAIVAADIQGIWQFGNPNSLETLATYMMRKLERMRRKHDQTLEYMEVNALRGITKDGAGSQVYNWHTEFGIPQLTVDFDLGNASTDVGQKCRQIDRHMRTHLLGESMTSALTLVSPDFWDKFIKHRAVKEAYAYYANTNNMSPLRDDLRTGFKFHGITFEEYAATVTLSNGSNEDLIPAGEGIAFPLGTSETFATYDAPGNFMSEINAIGQPMYAMQLTRPDNRGITIMTESNPLPVVTRPALCVKVISST